MSANMYRLPNEVHAARGINWNDAMWDEVDFRPNAPAPQPKVESCTTTIDARTVVSTSPSTTTNLPVVSQSGNAPAPRQNIGDGGWGKAQTVNDPRSGHSFKNEIHASRDGEWETVADASGTPSSAQPASSSGVLRYVGASSSQPTPAQKNIGDGGWGKAQTVNDPRSGHSFKNEIHADRH